MQTISLGIKLFFMTINQKCQCEMSRKYLRLRITMIEGDNLEYYQDLSCEDSNYCKY